MDEAAMLAELDRLRSALQADEARIAAAMKFHYYDGVEEGAGDCLTCGWESGWPCQTAVALAAER